MNARRLHELMARQILLPPFGLHVVGALWPLCAARRDGAHHLATGLKARTRNRGANERRSSIC